MAKHDGKLKRSVYEDRLAELHFELVKMQYWIKETSRKLVLIFEGRDAAGKGGAIKSITDPLNPRGCRVVALGTPSDREKAELGGHRILEIACGTGYWTAWLAPAAAAIVATDISPAVLSMARQKLYPAGRVRVELADAYELGGVAGDFTAAFAGFWWSHVPRERQGEFLTSLAGRLGPGARVVLLDNRYIDGSSTPLLRRDTSGNTYQHRQLADARVYEVLKNFPTQDELSADLAPFARDLELTEFDYYWGAAYTVRRTA